MRQSGTDTRYLFKQGHWITTTAQTLQTAHTAQSDVLINGTGDAFADSGQCNQARQTFIFNNFSDRLGKILKRARCPSVRIHTKRTRTLLFEQSGDLV